MIRSVLVVLAAMVLCVVEPASAQDAPSRASGERIVAIQAILSEPDGVPALFDDPAMARARATGRLEDAATAIRTVQPKIDIEQARLQRAVSRLQALPPMDPRDEQATLLDQVVRDAIRSSQDMERFLADLEAVLSEIDTGDAEGARAALIRLRGGGFAMIDNRSLMMRARAAMIPAGVSERFSALSGAETYKGMGQIVRMAQGFSSAAQGAAPLNAAATALEADVIRGRALLAEEMAAVSALPPGNEREIGLQLLGLQGQVFAAYGEALTILTQADAEIGRNPPPETLSARMAEIGAGFTPIEQRLVALNTQAMTLAARLRQ